MKDLSDRELIEAYSESENKAYIEELYLRYSRMVYRIALKYTANNSDAEDAMQVVFIDIMREAHQLKTKDNIKSWIIRMLINNCKDNSKMEKRRRKRQEVVSSRRPTYSEPKYEDDTVKKVVLESVNQLPERYRAPILLHFFEEFSFADMAVTLQVPEKTARTQLSRGLERLKKILATTGFIIPLATIVQVMQSADVRAEVPVSLDSSFIYQATNTVPLKVATSKVLVSGTVNYFGWVAATFCVAIIAAVPIVLFYSKTESSSKKEKISFPMQSSFRNVRLLTFEGAKASEGWEKYNGSVRIEKEGGINNKSCLKMEENSAIAFDVSGMKLPIQITIKTDHIVKDDMKLSDVLLWSEYNEGVRLFGISNLNKKSFVKGENGTRLSATTGKWFTRIFVIYEDRIEIIIGKQLLSCQKYFITPKGKLVLYSAEGLFLNEAKIEEMPIDSLTNFRQQDKLYDELFAYVEKNAKSNQLTETFEKTELAKMFFKRNGGFPTIHYVKSDEFMKELISESKNP